VCFLAETVVSWEAKRMTHGEGGCVMIGQIADQLVNQTAKVLWLEKAPPEARIAVRSTPPQERADRDANVGARIG
jgi:hypothetical protein